MTSRSAVSFPALLRPEIRGEIIALTPHRLDDLFSVLSFQLPSCPDQGQFRRYPPFLADAVVWQSSFQSGLAR